MYFGPFARKASCLDEREEATSTIGDDGRIWLAVVIGLLRRFQPRPPPSERRRKKTTCAWSSIEHVE